MAKYFFNAHLMPDFLVPDKNYITQNSRNWDYSKNSTNAKNPPLTHC